MIFPSSKWLSFVVLSALLGCGVDSPSSSPSLTGTVAELVSGQGRQSQGRQSQGTNLGDNFALKRYLASSFRKTFPGEPVSTVDDVRLVEGELVMYRSLPSGTTASLAACGTGAVGAGVARACGWKSAGRGRCAPASAVRLGAGAAGACGGTCVGNPMLRVCTGTAPCEQATALASSDDACGSPCPSVAFTCPASGHYNVLIAPFTAGGGATVALKVSAGTYPEVNVTHRGAELSGGTLTAEFKDGTQKTFKIAQVLPELEPYVPVTPTGRHGRTFRYQVQEPKAGGGWQDLCGPDYDQAPVALPVAGWWDASGSLHSDAGSFTFACKTGVISKCYRWGYRPWDGPATYPRVGVTVTLAQVHQACTRMARADYCGDGRSFTYDGTLINLWDLLKPQFQVRASDAPSLTFEAGWSEKGAVCLSHARWSNAPAQIFDPIACPDLFRGGDVINKKVCNTQEQALEFGHAAGRTVLTFDDSKHNLFDGGM